MLVVVIVRYLANSVLNKGKSTIPPLFNGPEVWSFASNKAKLFTKNFSMNSNLDDSGISLPVFPSRTNVKQHNISITPKMVKKVIANLDLSKTSGLDCIPVVVIKNCEPELSTTVVSKVFEKLVNNRIIDHLEKCGLFSDFHHGFSSSRSTADLLRHLCLIELLELLASLRLLEL